MNPRRTSVSAKKIAFCALSLAMASLVAAGLHKWVVTKFPLATDPLLFESLRAETAWGIAQSLEVLASAPLNDGNLTAIGEPMWAPGREVTFLHESPGRRWTVGPFAVDPETCMVGEIMPTQVSDLDGDGRFDMAIGMPLSSHEEMSTAGHVMVLSGSDGRTLWQSYGDVSGRFFGAVIASVGDSNGDGVQDIVIGSGSRPGYFPPVPRVPTLTAYSGRDGVRLWSIVLSSAISPRKCLWSVPLTAEGEGARTLVLSVSDGVRYSLVMFDMVKRTQETVFEGSGVPSTITSVGGADGQTDIVVGLEGGGVIWVSASDGDIKKRLDYSVAEGFALHDLDGDGEEELALVVHEAKRSFWTRARTRGAVVVLSGASGLELYRRDLGSMPVFVSMWPWRCSSGEAPGLVIKEGRRLFSLERGARGAE